MNFGFGGFTCHDWDDHQATQAAATVDRHALDVDDAQLLLAALGLADGATS